MFVKGSTASATADAIENGNEDEDEQDNNCDDIGKDVNALKISEADIVLEVNLQTFTA